MTKRKTSYYKIRLKSSAPTVTMGWTDDYNNPDPKNKKRTKRYGTLAQAKKDYNKVTWGIPHYKKIVHYTPNGAKTVYETKRIFKLRKR